MTLLTEELPALARLLHNQPSLASLMTAYLAEDAKEGAGQALLHHLHALCAAAQRIFTQLTPLLASSLPLRVQQQPSTAALLHYLQHELPCVLTALRAGAARLLQAGDVSRADAYALARALPYYTAPLLRALACYSAGRIEAAKGWLVDAMGGTEPPERLLLLQGYAMNLLSSTALAPTALDAVQGMCAYATGPSAAAAAAAAAAPAASPAAGAHGLLLCDICAAESHSAYALDEHVERAHAGKCPVAGCAFTVAQGRAPGGAHAALRAHGASAHAPPSWGAALCALGQHAEKLTVLHSIALDGLEEKTQRGSHVESWMAQVVAGLLLTLGGALLFSTSLQLWLLQERAGEQGGYLVPV